MWPRNRENWFTYNSKIGSGKFALCKLGFTPLTSLRFLKKKTDFNFLRYLRILSKNSQAAYKKRQRVDSHSKFDSSFHWHQCIMQMKILNLVSSGHITIFTYTVSLPSVILLSIRQHTPCRFSLFNLFVSIKLEETGDYSHHNFCFKILRIFGWFTRIFAGVSYRKLALLKQFCYRLL